LHPEIIKFYSDTYGVPIVKESERLYSLTFMDKFTGDHYIVVAYIPSYTRDLVYSSDLIYPFNGELLSEKEMLRKVRLKLFL